MFAFDLNLGANTLIPLAFKVFAFDLDLEANTLIPLAFKVSAFPLTFPHLAANKAVQATFVWQAYPQVRGEVTRASAIARRCIVRPARVRCRVMPEPTVGHLHWSDCEKRGNVRVSNGSRHDEGRMHNCATYGEVQVSLPRTQEKRLGNLNQCLRPMNFLRRWRIKRKRTVR